MPVDPELLELMVDTIDQEPFLGQDFDNVESYGPAVTHQCHISAHTEEVLRDTGDTALATHRIVLSDRVPFDERDKITMPARFKVTNPEILAVLEFTDNDPVNPQHHTTLKIGSRSGSRN